MSPADVQRRLGHSAIKRTVDRDGKWRPMANKAAVGRLDETAGSEVVQTREQTGRGGPVQTGTR